MEFNKDSEIEKFVNIRMLSNTYSFYKPKIVNIDNETVILMNANLLYELLVEYIFTAKKYVEDNGSITLSLNELDLIANDINLDKALLALSSEILEYANDYFNEFEIWSKASNRKKHLPLVLKAIFLKDTSAISKIIQIV